MKKIRLSIQEIVRDFEMMIRYHERLDAEFDFEKATDTEIEEFRLHMVEMTEKYLPTYKEHLSEDYFKPDTPAFDRALELYGELYENFRHMFYQML